MTLGELGPWVLSVIALMQVWVIRLWQKYRRPVVEIYESGNIEIGFFNAGPTITLYGTLRVRNRDIFIKNINIELIREKDNATHNFNWRAFRPHTVSLAPLDSIKMELASSFLLTLKDPFKFGIVFIDDEFVADVKPNTAQIGGLYYHYRIKKLQDLQSKGGIDSDAMANNPLFNESIYKDFQKEAPVMEAFQVLERRFYWTEGDYRLNLKVECIDPIMEFNRSFHFILSKKDEENLNLNIIGIMRSLCGFNEHWNFAYPEYGQMRK